MLERMRAVHRWCLTGTPIGRGGLQDIRGLLHALDHDPFAGKQLGATCTCLPLLPARCALTTARPLRACPPPDASVWRAMLAPSRGAAERWQVLAEVLTPLLWRNTKAVMSAELTLPPRSLVKSVLTFLPGEAAYYETLLQQLHGVREELADARRKREEHAAEAEAAEVAASPAIPKAAQAAARKRKQHERATEKLELAAVEGVSQLRMAAIHPQLTASWKELRADLQLK